MSKASDLIGRLLANKRAPFKESDKFLESLPVERLEELVKHCETAAAEPVPAAATAPVTPTTPVTPAAVATPVATPTADPVTPAAVKPKTEEEFLRDAPESLRQLVSRAKAEDAARRVSLISALKEEQTVFDEAALTAKSTDELSALARMLNLDAVLGVDYSVRGFPRVEPTAAASAPPEPYTLALEKRKNERQSATKPAAN